MRKRDITAARIFVPTHGGDVVCVNADGEVRFVAGLQPGIHFANMFSPFMNDGDTLEVTEGVTMMKPGGHRLRVQQHPKQSTSGANPDFRPTAAGSAQAQIEHSLRKLTERSRQLEKRMASFQRLQQQAQPVTTETPQNSPSEGQTDSEGDNPPQSQEGDTAA